MSHQDKKLYGVCGATVLFAMALMFVAFPWREALALNSIIVGVPIIGTPIAPLDRALISDDRRN